MKGFSTTASPNQKTFQNDAQAALHTSAMG